VVLVSCLNLSSVVSSRVVKFRVCTHITALASCCSWTLMTVDLEGVILVHRLTQTDLQGRRQVKKCGVDRHGERKARAYNGGLEAERPPYPSPCKNTSDLYQFYDGRKRVIGRDSATLLTPQGLHPTLPHGSQQL